MYIPAPFREDDLATLHALMQSYSFATLVTQHEGRPFASHLPLLLDENRGPYGTLRAHLARANPQWQDSEGEALVLFQGPHAYISPAWYATHPSVPTWNYAVVHAYGALRLLDDAGLAALLRDLVEKHEGNREDRWRYELPEEHLATMRRGIVGFEIEIARIEGKFKLGQNRAEADRAQTIAALRESEDPVERTLAEWMKR